MSRAGRRDEVDTFLGETSSDSESLDESMDGRDSESDESQEVGTLMIAEGWEG
jgi:hypothetical protein